nr:Arf1g [Gefionella okellyi]
MGNCVCFRPPEERALIVGLDASGKTTLLYALALHQVLTAITPTIGFNVESFRVGPVQWTAWDVGGGDKIHALWRHYFQDTTLLMYTIACDDTQRLDSSVEEFDRYLRDFVVQNNIPIVFVLTKVDALGDPDAPARFRKPYRTTVQQIREAFRLHEMTNPYYISEISAHKFVNIHEPFLWANSALRGFTDGKFFPDVHSRLPDAWSMETHRLFPKMFRNRVMALLCAAARRPDGAARYPKAAISMLPQEVVVLIVEHLAKAEYGNDAKNEQDETLITVEF